LHDHEELVSALANAEAALGLTEQAAKTHRELADRLIARDEGAALVHLRAAFELCPDDALGHRIDDLEAGRVCRRRRRRRIVRLAAAILLASGLGVGWLVGEWRAASRLALALEAGLGDLADGEGVQALVAVQQIAETYPFTTSGRRAPFLLERLVDLQLEAVRRAVASGDYARAERVCTRLAADVQR